MQNEFDNALHLFDQHAKIVRFFTNLGINARRMHVLLLLELNDESGGIIISELAEKLLIERNSCTELLKRMAAAGQILRLRNNENDEREVRAIIQPTGKAILKEFLEIHLPKLESSVF